MCGRFTLTMRPEDLETLLQDEFAIEVKEPFKTPHYNVAPTMDVIGILYDGERFRAGSIHWGFQFSKLDQNILAFNTRIETIAQKPFFKNLVQSKRLAIVSNGYFEWDTTTKTPYYMHYENDAPMFLGGIWRRGDRFESSIITLPAPDALHAIHPRVPFSMRLSQVQAWLKTGPQDPAHLYQMPDTYKVISKAVNKVAHNDASILASPPPSML